MPRSTMDFLLVFLGGGVGAALRHGMNLLAARLLGGTFPWGTLCINVLGSFVMGAVVEFWAQRSGLPQQARLFLTTGVLGGFTTFSAFSLEVALLHARGQTTAALLYATGSVALGVGALCLGMAAVR